MDVWGLSLMEWSRYELASESGGIHISCWDCEPDAFGVWSSDLERLVELAKAHEKEFHNGE